ncbi:hypothetical protein MAL08_12345 [Leptospira noguchii]|uniref:hypothetical protein n=1 Tax=Leptospira noguchii TaxID=28182 RepID=UPI000A2F7888|nr:hypothetical protein [Leptospira noguchii]UOG39533.1 hypothetical protein MAL08_12345 [Leptospira noguchii]
MKRNKYKRSKFQLKTVYKFLSYNSPLKNEFTIGEIPLLNFNLIMNLNSKFYKKIFLRKLECFTYKSIVSSRFFFREN